MNNPAKIAAVVGLVLPQQAWACTATNDNHDQTCTTSCKAGETAHCVKGNGSSAPDCYCSSSSGIQHDWLAKRTSREKDLFRPQSGG
jgi:hypothetical protein